MSTETLNLTSSVYHYLLNLSLRENKVLKQLRDETHKLDKFEMQISPEQGQFMSLLIELMGATKTLDIGTFTGYSAMAVALALPHDGKVITCDINVEWTNIAKRFWEMGGVSQKIDLRLAPALETLQVLLDKGEGDTFDFAFIDADKLNYLHYYETVFKLLRTGGLLAIDNVLWSGEVANPSNQEKETLAIRKLNETVFQDERVSISMLPIGDGLTLVRKR
jgi:caffeoyl-CoA O-methyltransferase